jgi:hypothetical protein
VQNEARARSEGQERKIYNSVRVPSRYPEQGTSRFDAESGYALRPHEARPFAARRDQESVNRLIVPISAAVHAVEPSYYMIHVLLVSCVATHGGDQNQKRARQHALTWQRGALSRSIVLCFERYRADTQRAYRCSSM